VQLIKLVTGSRDSGCSRAAVQHFPSGTGTAGTGNTRAAPDGPVVMQLKDVPAAGRHGNCPRIVV
jgi:hypothetical protein